MVSLLRRLMLGASAPLLVATLFVARPVIAETAALDEAIVAVANQSDAAREAAAAKALLEVLVKLSGDRRAVAAHPELLKDAARKVQEYQYRSDGSGQQLWFKFDPGNVRQMLTAAGLPLWGAPRPSLLLWQVTEQGGSTAIATASAADVTTAALRDAAARRGISLVLPMLDASAPSVAVDDVRHLDVEKLRAASSPYAAGEIAAAAVSLGQDGIWRGRYTLLRGEHGQTWVAQAATVEAVAAQGIDQIVDVLAAPVAAASTGTTAAAEVRVAGLATLQQLAQVESYLRSLPGASRVDLLRLEPSQATFRMLATGGPAAVVQAIAAGQQLLPAGPEGTYRLNPALPAVPAAAPNGAPGADGTAGAAGGDGEAVPATSEPAPAM